jgi:hypothetical protein
VIDPEPLPSPAAIIHDRSRGIDCPAAGQHGRESTGATRPFVAAVIPNTRATSASNSTGDRSRSAHTKSWWKAQHSQSQGFDQLCRSSKPTRSPRRNAWNTERRTGLLFTPSEMHETCQQRNKKLAATAARGIRPRTCVNGQGAFKTASGHSHSLGSMRPPTNCGFKKTALSHLKPREVERPGAVLSKTPLKLPTWPPGPSEIRTARWFSEAGHDPVASHRKQGRSQLVIGSKTRLMTTSRRRNGQEPASVARGSDEMHKVCQIAGKRE